MRESFTLFCQLVVMFALFVIFGMTVVTAIQFLSPEVFGAFVVLFGLLVAAHFIFWFEQE